MVSSCVIASVCVCRLSVSLRSKSVTLGLAFCLFSLLTWSFVVVVVVLLSFFLGGEGLFNTKPKDWQGRYIADMMFAVDLVVKP